MVIRASTLGMLLASDSDFEGVLEYVPRPGEARFSYMTVVVTWTPPLVKHSLVGRTKARDIEGEGEGVGVLGTPLKRKSMEEEEAFAGIELHGADRSG